MVCLRRMTINDLLKLNLPTDTIVYFVDFTNDSNVSDLYVKYLNLAYKLFGISQELINSRTRIADVCEVRHIVWCAMRHIGGISANQIGQLVKRNHSTILSNTASFIERMKVDKKLRQKYEVFCNSINKDVEDFDKKFEDGK